VAAATATAATCANVINVKFMNERERERENARRTERARDSITLLFFAQS
jgi:hypothetical protein